MKFEANGKILLRVIAFSVVLLMLLAGISMLLNAPGTSRVNYQWIHSFYDEPKNTLDGVLIGSSHLFTGWLAPLAWEQQGIAVWPFTSSRQPMVVAKELIEEARKTQPDAVYIVELSTPDEEEVTEGAIHDLVDSMPTSLQKFRIINELCNFVGYDFPDRWEYFFPLIRYHSQWSELEETNFDLANNGLKGACTRNSFLASVKDNSAYFQSTDKLEEVPETTYDALEKVLQYCESEQVKVVFLLPPTVNDSLDVRAQHNTLKRICEERGFPVIDERQVMEEIGLDTKYDYYDGQHTNIHGAIKRTEYLAQYLMEHYDLEDKRGNPGYESWDESYELYRKIADSHTLDFEWDGGLRDTALSAPKLSELKAGGNSLTVSWTEVSGADGYRVYRKAVTDDEDPPGWEWIAEVDKNTLEYEDAVLAPDTTYCYTAVAFRKENDLYYFGRVSYKGITGTALLDAPGGLELSGATNDLTLSWEGVYGADGYEVSRGILGDVADRIETDVGAETSYRDAYMLSGVPYGYQVKAYRYDAAGEKVYGSLSSEAVWVPDRSGPEATVRLVDGVPALSWEKMEAVTGYWVSRKEAGGAWEPLTADALPPSCTSFQDMTAKKDTEYTYRVQAFLDYEEETYRYYTETGKITAEQDGIELPTPEMLLCEQVGDKIFVVWEPVETATQYRVYRYRWDEETGTWADKWTTKITNPACQQKLSESGRYLYAVRALYESDDCTYLGIYDESMGGVVEYNAAG